MNRKLKDIYKRTIIVKTNDNTQMHNFRGEKIVRYYDRILSNQKKCNKNSIDQNQTSHQQNKKVFS